MNHALKIASVILAVVMVVFVVYIFAGDPKKGPPKPSLAANAGNVVNTFTSYKECRECHPDYFEEWERSWHRMAWTDPWVQLSWGCYRDQECKSCHLPQPIMLNGKTPRLVARDESEDVDSGINCLTCHWAPQGILGPKGREVEMIDNCKPVYFKDIATDAQCWECHPNQYDDWRGSSFEKNGEGCKSCHMDEIERPLVPNGPVRKTRVHFWKGSHTYTYIKTGYEFLPVLKPDGVEVTIKNTRSGHLFPAERHNRAIWVEVTFYDENGAQNGEMTKWIIREGSNLPRNMKTMDIKPDGSVSKKFAYPIAKGSVKLVFKFDYFYSNEDEYTRVLEDPPAMKFEKGVGARQ